MVGDDDTSAQIHEQYPGFKIQRVWCSAVGVFYNEMHDLDINVTDFMLVYNGRAVADSL